MKITGSAIVMESKHDLSKSYMEEESLKVWTDRRKTEEKGPRSLDEVVRKTITDQLEISAKAREALENEACRRAGEVDSSEITLFDISDEDRQKILILERLLSAVTGREVKIRIPEKIKIKQDKLNAGPSGKPETPRQDPVRQGWGLEYHRRELYHESESLAFAAKGIVKTADGREIDFESQLKVSREFIRENNLDIRAGDARLCDPLVINFDGASAALTNQKFSFDLDVDGRAEQLSFVGEGSGFLAIDQNNDGQINNGAELFGPASGEGFTELARYDQDHNGWIDENDAIYERLRIWTKDAGGKDILFALGQKGIGAIYLGNIQANFDLKNQENQLLGKMTQAGIYLKENGGVGTVQQLDLVV